MDLSQVFGVRWLWGKWTERQIDGLDHAVGFVWEDMALVGEVLKEPTGVFIQLVAEFRGGSENTGGTTHKKPDWCRDPSF